MKKILVILAILIIVASPLFAMGAAIGGLVAGIAGAAAGGAAAGVTGAVVGAAIGAVGGAIVGGLKQYGDEKEKKAVYDGYVVELNAKNKELAYQNEQYQMALDAWEGDYVSQVGQTVDTYEQNIKDLKNNWAMINAGNGSVSREGRTVSLLANEAKNRVISYAGEDMELNTAEVERTVADSFNKGDSSLLDVMSKNYGIYDYALKDQIASLRQNRQTLQQNIANNTEAITGNKKAIKKYENLEDDLFFV